MKGTSMETYSPRVRPASLSVSVIAAVRILTISALIVLAAPALSQTEDAKSFPSRIIRIIVPASPGGVNDLLARLIGQKMSEGLGAPVIVENKAGAATIIGAEMVARSAPDGYTILIAPTSTIAINPAVYSKLSYAPQRDFIPISAIASYPYVLTANSNVPARTVTELIDFAKSNPDKANAGGASISFQLLVERFKARTGAPLVYVQYKSAGDAAVALMGQQLTISFLDIAPAAPIIKSGHINALAVTAPARLASLPDVPTMAESGLKDMTILSWAGLFVPAGTPAPIVGKLQDEVMRIVRLPDIQQKLKEQELAPLGNTSKEFQEMIARDTDLWADIARVANVRLN